jgi:ribosomal protein L22
MGKDKNPRRVADNEAMAKTRMLRTSPQKLNLVAAMIRGKKSRQGSDRPDLLEEAYCRRRQEMSAIGHRQC